MKPSCCFLIRPVASWAVVETAFDSVRGRGRIADRTTLAAAAESVGAFAVDESEVTAAGIAVAIESSSDSE